MKKILFLLIALETVTLKALLPDNVQPKALVHTSPKKIPFRLGIAAEKILSRTTVPLDVQRGAFGGGGKEFYRRGFKGFEVIADVHKNMSLIGRIGQAHHFIEYGTKKVHQVYTREGASYGLGALATLPIYSNAYLEVHGLYSWDRAAIDQDRGTRKNTSMIRNRTNNYSYCDRTFTGGIRLKKHLGKVTPYVGMNFLKSKMFFKRKEPQNRLIQRKNKNVIGGALGVLLMSKERAPLNLETRFGNEKALGFSGHLSF